MASAMAPQAPAETDSPKILVVDDNADKRVALRAMLAPLGHTVLEAASGRAALELLLRETVAMILMDVRMPTLNGFETAKLCRSQSRGGRTPIIFVTAMGSENGEAASAYASGAVDFIFTPVLPEILRAKVTAFVDLFIQSQRLQQSLDSITELNLALRDSDVLTQAVLDNVAEGIFILDEHGRIESVNRSVGRLFGYHAQEPVGHSFAFMIDGAVTSVEPRPGLLGCPPSCITMSLWRIKLISTVWSVSCRVARLDTSPAAAEAWDRRMWESTRPSASLA